MDYVSRIAACALLAVVGSFLLAQSTFILRMRNDIPGGGPQVIALAVAVALSILPLLAGRRFLRVLILSAFLVSGIGAYWWTLIPWDALITDSQFPVDTPPGLGDYVMVALPAVVVAMYVVASRASRLMADCKNRGIDRDEAVKAAAMSYLVGVGALLAALAGAATLWVMLSWGLVAAIAAGLPSGVPALLGACALVVLAWAIQTRRLSWSALAKLRVPMALFTRKATG